MQRRQWMGERDSRKERKGGIDPNVYELETWIDYSMSSLCSSAVS
jgi:hypothetical protein